MRVATSVTGQIPGDGADARRGRLTGTAGWRARVLFICLVLGLGGCQLLTPRLAAQILGSWETEVGGFPVTSVYSATTVTVGDGTPVPYELHDGILTVQGAGSHAFAVRFGPHGQMVLVDQVTGTEQVYRQVGP